MDFLTLTRHNSFQNENNRKATHSFVPRPLIFKLQQEVLKWTNFLNPENQSFENVSIITFKYLTFFYLVAHLFLFLTYLFLKLNKKHSFT